MGNILIGQDNSNKKIGRPMYGQYWECPYCSGINLHEFPYIEKGTPSFELHMVGTVRNCPKCKSEYILG